MREPILRELTADAYLEWEAAQHERHELHHGFTVAFAGGTFRHNRLAIAMLRVLERLYPAPCRTFSSDMRVRVAEDMFFYADAGVVCEPVADDATYVERPAVVVEVLSRSTSAYDRIEKRAAYRALPSLASYVIVHADVRRIEVDERGLGGRWHTRTYDGGVASIGAGSFPLDEVYGDAGTGTGADTGADADTV